MDSVVYYTKKRQDDANYSFISEENKGLVKGEKTKMSPFHTKDDKEPVRKIDFHILLHH
jgi:hypothetical protein